MKRVCLGAFLLLAVYSKTALAQIDPQGVQDSVYVVCGKDYKLNRNGLAEASFQLRFFSDNTGGYKFTGFTVPLLLTGSNLVSVDTTVSRAFAGSIAHDFEILILHKEGIQDPTVPPFRLVYGGVSYHGGITGESLLVNITVAFNDTGFIYIDTFRTRTVELWFQTEAPGYYPRWSGPYCCWVYVPGDVNLDKKVDIVDVVAMVGYLFRQRELDNFKAADVNGDCQITLADIFYLANYVFMSGANPQARCEI